MVPLVKKVELICFLENEMIGSLEFLNASVGNGVISCHERGSLQIDSQ